MGFKKGLVPDGGCLPMTKECSKEVDINTLNGTILAIEVKHDAKRCERYHVRILRSIETNKPSGYYCMMYYQLNSTSTENSRNLNSNDIMLLVDRYNIQRVALAEYGTSFGCLK